MSHSSNLNILEIISVCSKLESINEEHEKQRSLQTKIIKNETSKEWNLKPKKCK